MSNFFQSMKKDMTLTAIFQLLAGLLLIIFSNDILGTVCRICGVALMVYGLFHIFLYMKKKTTENTNAYELVQGIVGIGAGVFVFAAVKLIIEILFIIFGILIVFDSIVKFQDAFDLKKLGQPSWSIMLVVSIVMAVLGILIIMQPAGLVDIIAKFAGIVMVVNACVDLWDIFFISRKLKNYTDNQ